VFESSGRHRRVPTGRPSGAALRRLVRTVGPIALVAITLVACSTSSAPPAPPTARVQRASVTTSVSSSGSLTALTEQNLGFVKGGQLKTVAVKVGQRVTTGQVLATVDDAALRRTLEEQQAQLDSQRAVLTRLVNATTVQGATNSTDQARAILAAQQDQAAAVNDADRSAVNRAEKQLSFDKNARDDAESRLSDAKKACAASGGTSTSGSATSGSGSTAASGSSSALLAALGSLSSPDGQETEKEKAARKKLEAALKAAGGLAGSLLTPSGAGAGAAGGGSATATNQACAQVATAQQAVDAADRQVEASRTALDAARNRRDVDEAAGRLAVENARQGVVTAQNNLDSAQTDRPSLIAQQSALVRGAEATVRQAQQDADDTVLRAPVDGTVSAVNGAVGEFLTAGSGTSALAPGSDAAIPGTGSTTGSGAAAPGASTGSVSRPGGSNFIVLDNIDRFEVVVPFEEADASRIAPNQRVDVRFDAIPDLTRRGTVVSVSPSATSLSGVISYYVTVALNETDPRLRNGQTAQASVVTDELNDVLTVPSAAVRRQGNQSTVTVLGLNGPQTVPFQPGVVGDDTTQVLSGLTAGDEVVVPSAR
jgi:HlyD family secretion protein